MTTFAVDGGRLEGRIITGGIDNTLPSGPGRPDNSLPGIDRPVDPGYGIPLPPVIDNALPPSKPTYPVDPDYGLPTVPGIWPQPPRPPHMDNTLPWAPLIPSHPIYILPPHVDHGLPGDQPGIDNTLPPGSGRPDHGLPGDQPGIDHTLPRPPGSISQPIFLPGHVWPPLPPSVTGTIIAFTWIVGVGYRWVCIDASSPPPRPTHPIDNPQPKG